MRIPLVPLVTVLCLAGATHIAVAIEKGDAPSAPQTMATNLVESISGKDQNEEVLKEMLQMVEEEQNEEKLVTIATSNCQRLKAAKVKASAKDSN